MRFQYSLMVNISLIDVETFMMSISEKKNSAEVRLIHAEQMSLYNFIVLRKTIDTAED